MDPNRTSNQQDHGDRNVSGFSTLNLSGRENSFDVDDTADLEKRALSGANWFFWIGGLSIVNSLIFMMDGELGFLAGLGITQIIDGLVQALTDGSGQMGKMAAITLNLPFVAIFAVFGLLARKMQSWAFIAGMALYGVDGLILLLVQDWIGMAFHGFALFWIFQGLRATNQLRAIQETLPRAAAKGA